MHEHSEDRQGVRNRSENARTVLMASMAYIMARIANIQPGDIVVVSGIVYEWVNGDVNESRIQWAVWPRFRSKQVPRGPTRYILAANTTLRAVTKLPFTSINLPKMEISLVLTGTQRKFPWNQILPIFSFAICRSVIIPIFGQISSNSCKRQATWQQQRKSKIISKIFRRKCACHSPWRHCKWSMTIINIIFNLRAGWL